MDLGLGKANEGRIKSKRGQRWWQTLPLYPIPLSWPGSPIWATNTCSLTDPRRLIGAVTLSPSPRRTLEVSQACKGCCRGLYLLSVYFLVGLNCKDCAFLYDRLQRTPQNLFSPLLQCRKFKLLFRTCHMLYILPEEGYFGIPDGVCQEVKMFIYRPFLPTFNFWGVVWFFLHLHR